MTDYSFICVWRNGRWCHHKHQEMHARIWGQHDISVMLMDGPHTQEELREYVKVYVKKKFRKRTSKTKSKKS